MTTVKDRWLQWDIKLHKPSNCVQVILNEYIRGKDDKWPQVEMVGYEEVRIYAWSNEQSICKRLNETQEKLLRHYANFYKTWDKLSRRVLPNFVGGKIVIDDVKTTEFINKLT